MRNTLSRLFYSEKALYSQPPPPAGKQKTKKQLDDVITITTTRKEQQALQWAGPAGALEVREDGMLTAKKHMTVNHEPKAS